MKNKLNIYVTQQYKEISSEFVKLMDLIDIQCIVHIDKLNFIYISKTYQKENHLIIYPYDKLIQYDSSVCEKNSFFIYLLEKYDITNTILQSLISQSIHTFYVIKYTVDNNDALVDLFENKMTYLSIPIHEISEKYDYDILYYGNMTERIIPIITELSLQFNINIIETTSNQLDELTNISINKYLSNCQIILLLNDNDDIISEYVLNQSMRHNVHIISERNDKYLTNTDFLRQYNSNIHFINEITSSTMESVIKYLSNLIVTKSNISNFLFLNKLAPFLDMQINFTNIYEFAISYKYNDIYKCINDIKHDQKIFHRFNCYNCIPSIQNIRLKNFDTESKYESVLIEFRQFPHIEFLIRNTIFKLGPKWKHTIVCGNYNYNFIKKIVESIDRDLTSKINIIHINVSFVNRTLYCSLMTSKHFWEQFSGDKILIYQEDTCIFKNNIDDFIEYDYIGAPWPKNQNDNSLNVGNGGFSLRSRKSMIEVIETVDPNDLKMSLNTKNYIVRSELNCVPEDIYFSTSMIDNKIGVVSTWNDARKFSQESIESSDPFGGHCFWNANDKHKIISLLTSKQTNNNNHMLTSIVNNFYSTNIMSDILNTRKIIFIDNIYAFFSQEAVNSLNTQWVGILTCFEESPNDIITNLMNQTVFTDSIEKCVGIIVYHSGIQNIHLLDNVLIKYLKLPCIVQDTSFDPDINTDRSKLCCVGCTIKDINVFCKMELEHHFNKSIEFINQVSATQYTTNAREYDINIVINNDIPMFIKSLQTSIVFMFANEYTHTDKIVLLIEHNVPFFINKTDSSCEYLGDEYPLYYDTISELVSILNNYSELQTLIQTGHEYLLHMDKSELSFEYFNSEVMKMIN